MHGFCPHQKIDPTVRPPALPTRSLIHNLTQPQNDDGQQQPRKSGAVRASSPAGERSSTSASSGGAAGCRARRGDASPSVERWTDSRGQSPRRRWARCSTTWSVSGRPCASVDEDELGVGASARGNQLMLLASLGAVDGDVDDAVVLVLVLCLGLGCPPVLREEGRTRRTVRRGFARTRRAPQVGRDASPGEGTMRRVSVRSWPRGRMQRVKVS